MASVPFPGPWSSNVDFTNNAVFALDSNGDIWLAGNSTTGGATLFHSTDHGITFTAAVTITGVTSSSIAFDPAIAIDSSDNIHLIGQVSVRGIVSLEKYTYTPGTQTLAGPFPITTQGIIGSDYDIVALSNGNCYVATALLTGTTESVEGLEVNASGDAAFTDVLLAQDLRVGDRYGSVSLWTPDGATVEIYLSYIPKAFSFADSIVSIAQVIRTAPDQVGNATVLSTLSARYASDKLTVLGNGDARYLAQGYYTQQKFSLIGNALLGYKASGANTWSFNGFAGTPQLSLAEPTISLSSGGLVLAVIDANLNQFQTGAPISLYDVNPTGWVLTPRIDFPYPGLANWLRGCKTVLPDVMPWGILAQRAVDGVARFYSGFNAPPIAQVLPATGTYQRGTTYSFDASGSSDPNLDPISFSWVLTDPTGVAVLTHDGAKATVELPASAGPAAQTLTLTVSVSDLDASGDVRHTSTASATLTYPLIVPPTIGDMADIPAARNSQVTITPTVTVDPNATGSYSWTQTAGTTVTIVSETNTQDLTIQTNGAAVAGETLIFRLTVSDGLNTPVSKSVNVVVAARVATGETQSLAHSNRAGNISQRNTVQTWTAPSSNSLITGFTRSKRAPVLGNSSGSFILIGPASVSVLRGGDAWYALTPEPTETILDAVHSDLDYTILLTSAQKLIRLNPTSPATDTDNAAATFLLSNITTDTFTRISATPPFAGQRVLILTGAQGCLLLQVDDSFTVNGNLAFNTQSGHLYGGSNIQWVRTSNIESLHTGTILIGTTDNEGNYFETEFSLSSRSVLGTWDSSELDNQTVSTGELLFETVDSYSGVPMPPVLSTPTAGANGVVNISWAQRRTDLVTGYTISITATGFSQTVTVGSGQVTSATATGLPSGATYTFSVVAHSLDGDSASSNSVSLGL